MIATAFDEENGVLDRPSAATPGECEPLSVWRGPLEMEAGHTIPVVISCWKMTAEELAEVQRTGRVWLMVWGQTMPPACLDGINPFKPS